MRISDWSSDVCSSDLNGGDDLDEKLRQGEVGRREPGEGDANDESGATHENEGRTAMVLRMIGRADRTDGAGGRKQRQHRVDRGKRRLARIARKSDVQGESEYVRVELGGRRIIKQK